MWGGHGHIKITQGTKMQEKIIIIKCKAELYRKGYHIISYTNYCVEHNTREAKEKAKICKVVLTVKDITRYLNDNKQL